MACSWNPSRLQAEARGLWDLGSARVKMNDVIWKKWWDNLGKKKKKIDGKVAFSGMRLSLPSSELRPLFPSLTVLMSLSDSVEQSFWSLLPLVPLNSLPLISKYYYKTMAMWAWQAFMNHCWAHPQPCYLHLAHNTSHWPNSPWSFK